MQAEKYIKKVADIVERRLVNIISSSKIANTKLKESMLYSLKAGGKRLRPALMFACYELKRKNFKDILDAGCAIEMLHTYSLIHDDLPAMDDDDLRRGKPTNHKIFGEGMAILAGDALLTDAFYHILSSNKSVPIELRAKAAEILSFRSGSNGMVSGQAADLENENFKKRKYSNIKLRTMLNYMHTHKTSDLIIAACQMGAILSGDRENFEKLGIFAQNLGLCFQIKDDILDVTADKKKLGKLGSDAKNGKLTFLTLYGLEKAKKMAEISYEKSFEALSALKADKENIDTLENLTKFVLRRDM